MPAACTRQRHPVAFRSCPGLGRHHSSPELTPPAHKPSLPLYPKPLAMRMADGAAAHTRPGIEQVYREVINVMRRHGAQAVAQRVLQELWGDYKDNEAFLRRAPWLQMLLVKWALQDTRVNLTMGPVHEPYTQAVHNRLLNKLWYVDQLATSQAPPPGAIWRLLRRIMHCQFEFQRGITWGFLRWPALLEQLPPGHGARGLFVQAMGMQPEPYMDLAVALFSVVHEQGPTVSVPTLLPLRRHYGADFNHFMGLFARTLPELRDALRQQPALRTRGVAELHEFPYLQRYPLLSLGDGHLQTWHPIIFTRGLENAVHHRLTDLGSAYTESYSKLFERYVTDLVLRPFPYAITEDQYRQMCGAAGKVVEVAVPFGDCNVLIEAKQSLFHDDVVLVDDPTVLSHKTERVRTAIKQGVGVGIDVRRPASTLHGSLGRAAVDFLIVVTNRDLLLVSGDHMQRLTPHIPLVPPNSPGTAHLPLHHIFIVDIADFEVLMGAVAEGKVHLPDLLRRAAQGNLSITEGSVRLSDHINWNTTPRPDVPLLYTASERARERVFANLRSTRQSELGSP